MHDLDSSLSLQAQLQQALHDRTPLHICGGNSKHFLGRGAQGVALDVTAHRGILEYDPRELVMTARAGTPLAEIEATLAAAGQMLAFEPPHFGATATLGGTIACGLSGARRPYAGSARDYTLGCRILNGRGEILQFGGQVMKNVAGYDVSRLMVGAYGTLGVLLDISLKVLPRPAASLTLTQACSTVEAIQKMSAYLAQPVPIDAACYHDGLCTFRVSGSEQAVKHAQFRVGGELMSDADNFWRALNEHELAFFAAPATLYRVLVKPATPPLDIAGKWLLDWGGAQRWLMSDESPEAVRAHVARVGGHVTQVRGGKPDDSPFQPLDDALYALHRRVKLSLDPDRLLNRGRLYTEL